MGENAIHAKYIELVAELKRLERDHAKEKQKLAKDKDVAKNQLKKANQTQTKIPLNAFCRITKGYGSEDKRLATCVEEIMQTKNDVAKRAKIQEIKYCETADIVVRVHCKYRAELYFKISRKTKLSRLFNAWTERMKSGIVESSKTVSGTQPQPPNGTALTTSSISSMFAW